MDIEVHNIRREYKAGSLSRKEMPSDPIIKCEEWLEDAIRLNVIEPTAMIVATCGLDLQPTTRTVLLKEIHKGRFIFYSNYNSRKGQQIRENSQVSLTFLWHQLERQIHIQGICEQAPPEVSDAYFAQRSYKSRIGARISPQSEVIPSRVHLVAAFGREALKYRLDVPRPESWGGFEVEPYRIEFWQGRESRLHDRFLYERQTDGTWSINRLAP